MNSSERLKRRWSEHRESMLAVVAKASENASKRNRTRWKKDRERMVRIASENAKKGTLALTGTKFSSARIKEHSKALTGRVLGGQLAKGPGHLFAREFCLMSPGGQIFSGRNLIHFVRAHAEMLDESDLRWKRGTCNAVKSLHKVVRGKKQNWKGWEQGNMDEKTNTLENELIERRLKLLGRVEELRKEMGRVLAELEPLDKALLGFGHGSNSGLADNIRKTLSDFGAQTPDQVHGRIVIMTPTVTRKDVSGAMAKMAKDGHIVITRDGKQGTSRIYGMPEKPAQ